MLAIVHLSAALLLTGIAPLWLLLVGPLILGVPHIVADIRYLLLRAPGRPLIGALLVPLGLLTLLRVVVVLGGPHLPAAEIGLGGAALLAGAFAAPPGWRRLLVAGLALAFTLAGLSAPHLAAVALAHMHNLVGFALWMVWARRSVMGTSALWAIGAAYVGAIALLLLAPISFAGLAGSALGLEYPELADALAPGLAPELAARVVLTFAFAQAVHYAVWLRLVPGTPPYSGGPVAPSFRRAFRDLRADLGRWGVVVAVALTALVPLWGLADPLGARETYLSVVLFHGWLELSVLMRLLATR